MSPFLSNKDIERCKKKKRTKKEIQNLSGVFGLEDENIYIFKLNSL